MGRVVTADWLAGTLTIFDLERLVDPDCTADDARSGSVDLSAYPPGPIELEIAPDGTTAVVAVGPGFFDGGGNALVGGALVPQGGALLVVDLGTGAVLHEIPTPNAPLGIAIAPDGTRAYVADYGEDGDRGTTMSVIDLAAGTVLDSIDVGQGMEQVRLSADGTIGMVNVDSLGGIRTFRTDDPAGTMTAVLATGDDPGDIAWIAGTRRAIVTCSVPFAYSVIDAEDPVALVLLETVDLGGIPYALSPIPGTDEVVMPVVIEGAMFRIDGGVTPSVQVGSVPLAAGSLPLGVTVDPTGRWAFSAHAGDRALVITDLEAGESRLISWLDAAGPTWVAIAP